MAKWTVALFGHQKYIPAIEDDPVEYAAAIKRAKPGDVVTFKPYKAGETQWTPTEYKQFLIVAIDGVTKAQMEALCEQEYDMDSYPEYSPMDILAANNEGIGDYNNYLKHVQEESKLPKASKNKRRFNVTPADLVTKGVVIERMLDTKDEYKPNPEVLYTDITDTLNKRKVTPTDGLNMIKPLTDEELEARKI